MEIKIIDTNLLTDEDIEKYIKTVSSDTVTKSEKMRFECDRRSTTVAEALAKQMLANKLNINADEIEFKRNKYGKPYIDNVNVHFNISHSAGVVAVAVNNTQTGIDIEKIRPVDTKIIKRICTENEEKYIFSSKSESELQERFFTLWTLKEAYFKCIGTGITENMKTAEFIIKDGKAFPKEKNLAAVTSKYENDFIISVIYCR